MVSLEISKCKLVSEAKGHLRVLQHMVKAEVLDQVVRRVDLLIRVFKFRFDDESRGIAVSAGRRVV